MDQGTAASPLFEGTTLDLLQIVRRCPGPEARLLEGEALRLALVFRSWALARPTDNDRIARITELFRLYRAIMGLSSTPNAPMPGSTGR